VETVHDKHWKENWMLPKHKADHNGCGSMISNTKHVKRSSKQLKTDVNGEEVRTDKTVSRQATVCDSVHSYDNANDTGIVLTKWVLLLLLLRYAIATDVRLFFSLFRLLFHCICISCNDATKIFNLHIYFSWFRTQSKNTVKNQTKYKKTDERK